MNDALRQSAQQMLAVTIAFTLGAAVITVSLYGLFVFGIGSDLGQKVDDWYALGAMIVSRSALAGLMIDALRLLAAVVWRKKPAFRLSLKEIVRQNLA